MARMSAPGQTGAADDSQHHGFVTLHGTSVEVICQGKAFVHTSRNRPVHTAWRGCTGPLPWQDSPISHAYRPMKHSCTALPAVKASLRVARRAGTAMTMVMLITACAATGVDVQRVASGNAPAVFELRGPDAAQLEARAQQLCPKGYQTLRQWQRSHHPAATEGWFQTWQMKLADRLDGHPEDLAQAQVQCRP
jgi:hypothetical protein